MSGPDRMRLNRELKDLTKPDSSGIFAEPVGGDVTHLRAHMPGPKDSPYEGGLWELDVVVPAAYPFAPPEIKFVNKIWHPNISSVTGVICLDILKPKGGAWSPALTVRTALLSISALLCAPEPTDPQDAQVASQYMRNRKEFEATARFWTESYAKGSTGPAAGAGGAVAPVAAPPEPKNEKLETLISMGFDKGKALAALKANSDNLESAMNSLLSS